MQVTTHLILANIIRENIYENIGIKLNKTYFYLGNIKPDVWALNEAHYRRKIIPFLDGAVNGLLNDSFSEREFTIALGVVCHYISDYFCRVHDDRMKTTSVQHGKYELAMDIYCRKNRKQIESEVKNLTPLRSNGFADILRGYDCLYQEKDMCYDRDLIFAAGAGISICREILAQIKYANVPAFAV